MAVKTFAAIDVGSYELSMKIFEVAKNHGMKEIDHIRYSIDMGTESYTTGKLSYDRVEELCRILREFADIMKTYQVSDYVAYGTSAIRETENTGILLDQIRQRTGIKIGILSNSEQRFLDYKSIAFQGEGFQKIIENGTAIVDIGGGSIQVSLFDKDTLVSTQNMKLGVLRLRERLTHLDASFSHYEELLTELVDSQLVVYKKLYLRDREIKNIIVVDDYISTLVRKKSINQGKSGYAGKELFKDFLKAYETKSISELSKAWDMPEENMYLLYISLVMMKRIMETMGAELIWAPGVTLSDGIAYEYAEKNKMIASAHDFEQDIIACAHSISKRYQGSKKRSETLEQIALTIFDSMKKIHGLGKRERLLLQISTILHDCGKYVSMANLGECSYSIIMATEIIGLSHMEREIVANVVKYNHLDFAYYEEMSRYSMMDREAYLKTAKLTAILRLANGLDRSHKQKFKNFKTSLKDNQLVITVDTNEDITLERGLFGARAEFFEEVYSIRPIIRQKRTI
ncbi:MAG: HD domain-containing protein [Lachnospiraceae bacterium]|nr:HD domain-containing protein [Lachnospiraceae bacterium]